MAHIINECDVYAFDGTANDLHNLAKDADKRLTEVSLQLWRQNDKMYQLKRNYIRPNTSLLNLYPHILCFINFIRFYQINCF